MFRALLFGKGTVIRMRHYDNIFFDLDGTLTDPGPGITNSVMYALEKFGISVPDRAALYPFIGPPLIDSFRRYYGFTDADARRAVTYYREYFTDTGIFENAVYPGIPELLERLRADGRCLAVATSKPEPFAERIAVHFELAGYFDCIAGAAMDETRTGKDEVIRSAMERCCISAPETVLMVGDREHDVLGAAKRDVDCLGVLYGYGSREELESAGALYLAETVPDVSEMILNVTN